VFFFFDRTVHLDNYQSFFFVHTVHLDNYQMFLSPPTDAQLNSLKNDLKFLLKFTLNGV